MLKYENLEKGEFSVIQELAHTIWNECYSGIISESQVDYMINMMYNDTVLQDELDKGYLWEILKVGSEPVGYLSYTVEQRIVVLKKIYILQKCRGLGLGRNMLERVKSYCFSVSASKIRLTVNKKNLTALSVYKKFGFVVVDEVVKDIGHGYVMDDYICEFPSG